MKKVFLCGLAAFAMAHTACSVGSGDEYKPVQKFSKPLQVLLGSDTLECFALDTNIQAVIMDQSQLLGHYRLPVKISCFVTKEKRIAYHYKVPTVFGISENFGNVDTGSIALQSRQFTLVGDAGKNEVTVGGEDLVVGVRNDLAWVFQDKGEAMRVSSELLLWKQQL